MAILTGLTWVVVGVVSSLFARRGGNYSLVLFLTNISSLAIVGGILATKGGSAFRDAFAPGMPRALSTVASFFFGFLNYYMLLAMNASMKRGPHGMAWTITQSGFILPFLMICAVFPSQAGLTVWRALGIAAILFNIMVDGVSKGGGPSQHGAGGGAARGWFWLALLAFFLCGSNQCCAELTSYLPEDAKLGVDGRMAWCAIGSIAGLGIHAVFSSAPRRLRARMPEALAALAGAVACAGVSAAASYFLFYHSMDRLAAVGAGSIAHPLMVGACFCGFFAYSVLFLRERPSLLQAIGFLAGLVGIALQCL